MNTTACKRLFSPGCVAHTDGAVLQRPGEGDAAFKHRTREANIDREYAKKIYAEPTTPSPSDGEPRAHVVKDYEELLEFISSER